MTFIYVINLRTCPASNFFLEGISKLIVLVNVGYLVINIYTEDFEPGDGAFAEKFLVIMVVGHILHELGELQDKSWSLSDYLAVSDQPTLVL